MPNIQQHFNKKIATSNFMINKPMFVEFVNNEVKIVEEDSYSDWDYRSRPTSTRPNKN